MEVGVGVNSFRKSTAEWIANLHAADGLGYGVIGMGDSQSIHREVYADLAVAARETRRARLAPMVTNPVTRHPTVTASAIATVDELSGGRAVLGFGRGNNAVKNVGEPRASTALLREYLGALRPLLRGEHTVWRGRDVHTEWVPRAVPVLLSAYGPKTLALAGEIADGVIICAGARPEIVADAIAVTRRAAERAGRDPDALQYWAMVRGSVRDDPAEAAADVAANVASGALMIPKDRHLPERLVPAVDEVRRRYAYREHTHWGGSNEQLVAELGLTDYLVDRLAVAGTPDTCRARVDALAETGLDVLYLAGSVRDAGTVVRRFATEVAAAYTRPAKEVPQ